MPNHNVLLMEPDQDFRGLLESHLRELGHHVTPCRSLTEALKHLEVRVPDVVLMDLQLPDGPTESLIETLYRMGRPIVLVMGTQTHVETRVRALNLGADGFLLKPFMWEELDAVLRAMVRRLGRGLQVWSWLGCTLERSSGTVSFEGREVHLTRSEQGILAELMRLPVRVVSRFELEEKVFGWNAPRSNSLQVRVSALRRKLQQLGAPFTVHNMKGVGYVLMALPDGKRP